MVSKDQSIGALIFIVCVLVAVFYLVTLFYPSWLLLISPNIVTDWMPQAQFWIIAIPVFIAFIAIMGIGAWIGWTMATTPPPKPIEEITSEIEKEKEEEPPPTEEEPKPAETPEEEKKPERKKKS